MNIIVTGNPATGKTTIAKRLAKLLNLTYLDITDLIKKNKIHDGYDRKTKSYIVPIPKFKKFLKPALETGNVIVDSHLSHYLDPKDIDVAIVTKCSNLKTLKRRLEKRKYSKSKVRENIDCEIFEVCLIEAQNANHIILPVDTSTKLDVVAFSRKVLKLARANKRK